MVKMVCPDCGDWISEMAIYGHQQEERNQHIWLFSGECECSEYNGQITVLQQKRTR